MVGLMFAMAGEGSRRRTGGMTMTGADDRKVVFVISDATGETAERMVRAALLQFSDAPVDLRMYTRVRLEEEMRGIVSRAKERRALVARLLERFSGPEVQPLPCERAPPVAPLSLPVLPASL